MPKSFQAPFALLEVDILHVLGPSSSLLWFQHVCACSIYFRLKKCLQSAALCNRVLARSRKNASRNSHATKSKEHSTVSTWRPSEQVIQLGVKCVTHTLSRSLPTLSMNSMNKLDGPLPLQTSWISASLLVIHSVGLEPANKPKAQGKSFSAILHLPCPASFLCFLCLFKWSRLNFLAPSMGVTRKDNSSPSCDSCDSIY